MYFVVNWGEKSLSACFQRAHPLSLDEKKICFDIRLMEKIMKIGGNFASFSFKSLNNLFALNSI